MSNKDDEKQLDNQTLADKFTEVTGRVFKSSSRFIKSQGKAIVGKATKKAAQFVVRAFTKIFAFITVHFLPIILITLGAFVTVAIFLNFVGANTDDEYETKYTAANYQEDAKSQNNKLQLNKIGVWGFNKAASDSDVIKEMSKSNKLYYVYYAYNAQDSYYLATSVYNNNQRKWVNDSKYTLVSGASNQGEAVQKRLSQSIGGGDVSKAIVEMSMSPDMLYMFDNAINKTYHGAGKKGFYFPEQFTKPVSYNSDDLAYEPITKQRKLTSEEKALYARKEDLYQLRYHASGSTANNPYADERKPVYDDLYEEDSGNNANAKAKDNDSSNSKNNSKDKDKTSDNTDITDALVNQDVLGAGVPDYEQESLSTTKLIAKSTEMNEDYKPNPKNRDKNGHIGPLPKNQGAIHYDENGQPAKSIGIGDYGMGTIFRIGRIKNFVYDQVTTQHKYRDNKGQEHESTSEHWQYNPQKSKMQMMLIGVTSPFGYIDLSDTIREQYEANYLKAKYDLQNIASDGNGKVRGRTLSQWGPQLPSLNEDDNGQWVPFPKNTFNNDKKKPEQGDDKFKALPDYDASKDENADSDNDSNGDSGNDSTSVTGSKQVIPTFDYTQFPDKDIHMVGLQYFNDYLSNLRFYVPDYVSTTMDVKERLKKIDDNAKDKNSKGVWKEIKKILDEASTRRAILSPVGGSSSSSGGGKAQKKKGEKTAGVAFVGGEDPRFMRTMKYWSFMQKYAKKYAMDEYILVAVAAHESGGQPGIHQNSGGPGFGLFQIELNGDGFGSSRPLSGYLANGQPGKVTATTDDNAEKQVEDGACYLSGGRIFKNVASSIIYHHLPAAGYSMQKRIGDNGTLDKALSTGIDSTYLRGALTFYGGTNPWVQDLKGVKHYGDGKTGAGEGGAVADEGLGNNNIFNKVFGWIGNMLSQMKDVGSELFNTQKGVDIWSEKNANNYAWSYYDGHQTKKNIHDLAVNYLALLLSNASPNLDYYYSTVQDDDDYNIGRRIDDYYYNVMKNLFTGSNTSDDDGSASYGSPLKKVPDVNKLQVNSTMGWRSLGNVQWHQGWDLTSGTQPIIAVADGTVAKTGYAGGHGNYVVLKVDGTYVYYQHLSKYSCHEGQHVKKGEELGITGGTGGNFAVHLHFGQFKNGDKWTKNSYPFPPCRDTANHSILVGSGNGNAAENDYVSPGLAWGLSQKQDDYAQEHVNGYKAGIGHYKSTGGGGSAMTVGQIKKH